MTVSKERLAKNESLFRSVNERLDEMASAISWPKRTDYLCECSDTDCIDTIELDKEEYERARRRPTTFFVVPGHERSGVEKVVEEHERYVLVEKLVAVETLVDEDPRSGGRDTS